VLRGVPEARLEGGEAEAGPGGGAGHGRDRIGVAAESDGGDDGAREVAWGVRVRGGG
jgi:hypothetical protein